MSDTVNMSASEKITNENLLGEEPSKSRLFYIESYGCQMNFSDSEIVASILHENGYSSTRNIEEADAIFLNTCSIRDKAEQTVRNRLKSIQHIKKSNPSLSIGVLGCMAERLKHKFLEEEKLVDIVAGPDAYRDLPKLMEEATAGRKAVNVILSKEETYGEISPVRLGGNGVTAFVSITRGCDNMCTFCVVPFTRGRERSRDPQSILLESKQLVSAGYKEITLLGQNVDSYLWYGGGPKKDFNLLSPQEKSMSVDFAKLLAMVAEACPELRIRFSTSHPKDMTDEVLKTMVKFDNICNYVHLPFQSGNSRVLDMMNRGYTREWYLERIKSIRNIIPDCGISADIITGFCSETEEEHNDTLSLMEEVKFDFSYMFKYSERPNTLAQRKFEDDIPEEVKSRRLSEIIALQQEHSAFRVNKGIGKIHRVLVEGVSKKSDDQLYGRNDQNTVVVFPRENYKPGDYVDVKVESCTSATLIGHAVLPITV